MAKTRAYQGAGPSQRQLKVGEVIRRTLSEILARGEIHDPELNRIPEHLRAQDDAFLQFGKAIVDATAEHVCAFKPQAAHFAAFKKPGAPGRVRASKTSRMGSVCTPKASGRAVRTSARPAEPKGTRAGGWRRTPTTGEAGTHPRREWPAPAPRASPRPFRRRLRLKGDGSNRSWRRQTPGGLFVEQFAEQRMLNLDAT